MFYAKQIEDGFQITVLKVLFPDTSFPDIGPDAEWLASSGVYPVEEYLYYDAEQFKRNSIEPVLIDGSVYTASLVELTTEEKDQRSADSLVAVEESNKAVRAEAYRIESDPLFFQAQRNEITMDKWLEKVEEIKNRGKIVINP